jgi:hypothetical protein
MFDWLSGNGLIQRFGYRPVATPRRRRPIAAALRLESLEARNLLDATTLLIGTWNVDIADTNGANENPGGFQTVLAAMSQESSYANPQAPDILTITETRSNSNFGSIADTDWVTQQMNAVYGPGMYSHGTLNGNSTGGGTEGVIYSTQTVQLLQEIGVGHVSTSGQPRQELRYLFRPVGYDDGSADFYVYVGHYKSGYTTTDQNRRNVEAQAVRADSNALGPGTHILYTGDFNADSSNEPAEQTLLAAGNGQAFDPIGRLGQWYNNGAMIDIDTESTVNLDVRFDLLWETAPVIGDYGLQAIPSTYHSFGNNGSIPLHQSADYGGNTALSELPNQFDVLYALARQTTDHYPIVQLYQIATPSTGIQGIRSLGTGLSPAALTSATALNTQTTAPDGAFITAPPQGNLSADGNPGTPILASHDPTDLAWLRPVDGLTAAATAPENGGASDPMREDWVEV